MMIVDAHLDLAYNAGRGRAVDPAAREQAADDEGIPTVGLPDLRAGNVGLVCGVIFCEPADDGRDGYRTAGEAHDAALKQLEWYRRQEAAGALRAVKRSADLKLVSGETRAILLLEGADPIRERSDAQLFFDAGVRIV